MEEEAEGDESLFDEFLEARGHEVDEETWIPDGGKYQCPECGGVHAERRDECDSCGWRR